MPIPPELLEVGIVRVIVHDDLALVPGLGGQGQGRARDGQRAQTFSVGTLNQPSSETEPIVRSLPHPLCYF
jgi:hypothetical protein